MGLTLLTTVCSGVVLAAPAEAATNGTAWAEVNIDAPDTVAFTAGIGRENNVVISGSGGMVTIDDTWPINPGLNCEQVPGDLTRVNCYVLDPVADIHVETLGWNDSITNNTPGPMSADGGAGNDIINGGSSDDRLIGGDGADKLWGHAGEDWVSGDAGNDRVSGGEGNDTVFGGADDDLMYGSYGDDTLDAGLGNDRLDGGPNDTAAGDLCLGKATDVKTGCER
ncbi:calcium-binding protein [Micromonospora echinospora]